MQLPIIFRYRYLWHMVFWIGIYLSYVISYGGYADNFASEFKSNAILLPVRIVFTYSMLYFMLPLLIKKEYTKFILLTGIHAFLFGLTLWTTYREYSIHVCGIEAYKSYPIFKLPKIFVNIISNYGIPLLAGMLKLFKWWYIDQQYKVKIEKEKLESELNYLKAQIHPHFLFNTLNNLYALTLQNSSKASDVVIKLSGLLDYMLYHSKADKVPLEKELTIINNYIELEKIRYGDRLKLTFEVVGDKNTVEIAPLILIPFVENAFKHGASNDRTKPVISIYVTINNNCIKLQVKNSIPSHKSSNNEVSKGIGLDNIKRQLDLIYPNSHKLTIENSDFEYKVNLNLNCI